MNGVHKIRTIQMRRTVHRQDREGQAEYGQIQCISSSTLFWDSFGQVQVSRLGRSPKIRCAHLCSIYSTVAGTAGTVLTREAS